MIINRINISNDNYYSFDITINGGPLFHVNWKNLYNQYFAHLKRGNIPVDMIIRIMDQIILHELTDFFKLLDYRESVRFRVWLCGISKFSIVVSKLVIDGDKLSREENTQWTQEQRDKKIKHTNRP